jgi:CRP/FNR family transcriptional regulator, cyclic AMP receptor protein
MPLGIPTQHVMWDGCAVGDAWPTWWAENDRLAPEASRQRYPAGATLFVEGEPLGSVLVIQRGDIKVSGTSASGREVVFEVLGTGEVVGELAALDGGVRSASAVALTDVEVLSIPAGAFRSAVDADDVLKSALLTEVIRRLRASDRRQLEFGSDALGRVCARLVELADRTGTAEVELPVNQSDLAAWTAQSREAVVKALASLRRLGWIETDGRRVQLLELDSIRERAAV